MRDVLAAELGKPDADVSEVLDLVCGLNLAWRAPYRAPLGRLVRLLDSLPTASAQQVAKGASLLVANRLCHCLTVTDVADALALCPDAVAPGACSEADDGAAAAAAAAVGALSVDLPRVARETHVSRVPLYLRCVARGFQPKEAEDVFYLSIEGAIPPAQDAPPAIVGLLELPPARRSLALRCMQCTALHTISDGNGVAPLPCDDNELQCITALVKDASLSDTFFAELLELADFGLYRSQWATTLEVLAGLPSQRRHDALQCAVWLHASAPRWLGWHSLFADVQNIECQEDRLMVVELIGDILGCGHDVEGRQGKDEDFAAGLSPAVGAWLTWLAIVAATPGCAEGVCSFIRLLQQLDPHGGSTLVRRLLGSHGRGGARCRWSSEALRQKGCPCYCYHVMTVLIPRLLAISEGADKALLDAIATFVRWRKGLELVASVEGAEALARAAPGQKLSGEHLVSFLQCHYLLLRPSPWLTEIFSLVPVDVFFLACRHWHRVEAYIRRVAIRSPAEAGPFYVYLLLRIWHLNPPPLGRGGRGMANPSPWERGLGLALSKAPATLMSPGSRLQVLLLVCCTAWSLSGIAEKDMADNVMQACRSFAAFAMTSRQAVNRFQTHSIFVF